MANQINYKINFETNTQSLDTVKKALQDIQKVTTTQFEKMGSPLQGKEAVKELMSIKSTAKEVEVALRNAFNADLGTYNITKLRESLEHIGLDKVYSKLGQIKTIGPQAFQGLSTSLLTTNLQMKQSNKLLDDMATSFKNTVKWGISSSVWNTMTNSLGKAWDYTKRLDSSLNDIRVVSYQTADQMERFAQSANRAAKELGTSTLDYTKAALIYYQQGLDGDAVTERTNATLKLANTTGEAAASVSDYMTAIWNNFEDGSHTVEYYADVLAKLGAETASSSDEIAAGLEKFASVAETVGLSYEYATSALTTITAATRQSADVVGTALKTLFSRIQDLELGNTLEDGTTLGKYSEALEKVGINIKTQSGELKDMDDILDEMGAKWDTLAKDQQVALAQAVAGVRQYNQLMALMNNWSDMEVNVERAVSAAGTLNKQQDIYMESTRAHLEQLGTAAERVMDAFVDNKGMNNLIDDATSLTTFFANFVESLGGGTNMLKMFGSVGAQVFGSQIATGISNMINNFKTAKNNAAALINDIEYLKSQKFSNSAQSDPVYQAGLAAANKFADNKGSMSKEELGKATALVQEVVEVNKLANEWERAKKQAIEYAQMVSTQESFGTLNNNKDSYSVSEEEILMLKDDLFEANKLEQAIEDTFKKIDQLTRKFGTKAGDAAGKAVQETDTQLRALAKDLYEYVERFTDQVGDVDLKAASELKNKVEGLNRKEKWIGTVENKRTGQDESKITVNTFEQLENIQKAKVKLFKDYEYVKGEINTYIKEEWDAETGTEKTTQLESAIENAENKVDSFKKELDFKDKIQGVIDLASAFGQISMGINTLGNLKNILNDEDLSTAEKMTQIMMALSTSIPMIINGLQLIKQSAKTIPSIVASMVGLTASEVSAAKAADTLGTAIWKALLPILPMVLGVAAAATVLVGTIYAIVKAYNAEADAAKEASEQAEKAAEIATEATEEYEKLANAFDKYDKGIQQLKDLTAGTEEYSEALKSANEAAMDLIENDNSLAKYAVKRNGLITFEKEDGTAFTQDELLDSSRSKMNSAKAASSLAQANANRAQQTLDYSNFLRDVDLDIDEQALKNAIKTTAVTLMTAGYGTGAALESGRQSMQNTLSTDDLSVIVDQLIADGGEEVFALGKVEESLNRLSGLTDEEKKTLLEHSDKLKELTTATIDLNATNKLLLQQSLEDSLENNKDYAGLSEDQKRAVSTRYGKGLTEDVEEELRTKAEEKWNQDGWFGSGNEDEVHQAYAKARGWTLSQDKSGDKAVYLDKEGNAQTVEDDDARAYLINQEVQNSLKDYDINSLNDIIKATKNIDTNQFNSKYGTDLESGILSTISSGGKLDTNALFAGISPSEIVELENFSGEQWKEALGLTDEEMQTLGLGSGQTFAENFKKAAEEGYKWDAEAAVKNAMNTMDTSPEDLGLDEEEFSGYAKHLMDMANETDNLADSMTEEAEAAVTVTRGIMRMNQGIDKLAEGQEEWIDILKNSSRTSEEYYDALVDMQDALADILDTEKEYISETFVKDHLDDIQKAADGDADAIDRLHKALAVDMVAHIAVDNQLDETQVQNLINQVQNIQIPDIEVGAKLDSSNFSEDEKAFLDQMLEIVESAKMTAEEANEFFGQMGFDANFETHPETITRQVPVTITESEITSVFPLRMKSSSYQQGTQPITETIEVPSLSSDSKNSYKGVTSLTRRATGSFNNYSSANKGGKSAGGGSSKETKYNTSNDKVDIYQEVNTQLQSTNDELKKIQSQTDKLTGLELIQNINDQIQNLNQNLDLTNKKLRIAQGEQQGFISQLQGYGVGFNADGSINQQSYVSAFNREQARFTSATTEDDAAKERWENFKQLITDYNNSVKNIDELYQDLKDTADKITDLKIQAFNMEIEITLDLDDARKTWEEFKRDVIDQIEDDDILGNANYNLESLGRYYDEQGLGKIQEETKYLNDLLNELRTMDSTGSADSYDDNRKQALEDLRNYYEQTMSDLTDIEDIIDDIEKSLGETLDDISDQMEEQLKAYDQLSDTLDHDMKLIQLVFGEDSYSKLEDYYAKKEENFNSRLDFQRQQVEFWEQQMKVLEEGTEEWETAKENWMSAVNDWQSSIESAIENLQDKYLNAINAIFENLNNQLTGGKGLAYINEEWELVNKNADRYLDTINSQYGIQVLQKKYLDAIDKTSNVAGQKKLTDLMNLQVEALKQQDKLSQADLDRADLKYQIAVKRLQLEEAQQNKSTMRLRRDSQGNYSYQYTADEDETSKLESELSDLYNQLYNFDKDQYTSNLDEMYAIWEEYQQKMTEAMQINDPEQREARKLLITQQYEELINGIIKDNEKIKQELHESTFLELADLYDEDFARYATLAEAEQEILMNQMIPQWNSGIQEMIDKFAGEGGFGPTCEEALNKLAETTEQYETDLAELQEAAAVSFEEVAKSIDPVLEKTGQLVKDNDSLFNSYQKQVDAINNVLNALRNLTAQYEGARKAASDAAEASYKYWEEQQRQAQAAAAKNDSSKVDSNSSSGSSSSGSGGGGQYAGYRLGGQSYTIRKGDTLWGIAKARYGNGGLWSEIWNNNRGNLRSGNPNLIYPGEVIRLDTGGYTGEWGNSDGKLALLHQKELVLNAQDTENILGAISMMRNMLSGIGAQGIGLNQLDGSGNALEQNVHIEANFPNVSSTYEIESALTNLVNAATQHVHRNK